MFTLRQRLAGTAALLLAVAACSKDATAPKPLDPTAALASLNGVDSTFQTPAVQSFLAVTALFNAGGTPAAPFGQVGALLQATAPRIPGPGAGPEMGAALKVLQHAMTGTEAILPDSLLGKTFIWDTTQARYVKSDTGGAPPNGIRFELYALDLDRHIIKPLVQVGHLDLIDKSTGAAQTLEVVVASSSFTYIDYTVSGSGTLSAFTLTASGFIRNSVRELDFSISYTVTSASCAITEQFDDAADNAHLTFSFGITTTSDTSHTVTLNFDYHVGTHDIALNGGGAVDSLTEDLVATVKVDGNVFALISAVGLRETVVPSLTDGNGQPLSNENRLLLFKMFVMVGRSLEWLNDFVGPFIALAAIGVLLSL
ncbi:MAG TPA: hypothetical protein VH113_06575 [Gemmatimonadales bacterium]|nr:hypothetical protein [Gemmatimonadales bacterium]